MERFRSEVIHDTRLMRTLVQMSVNARRPLPTRPSDCGDVRARSRRREEPPPPRRRPEGAVECHVKRTPPVSRPRAPPDNRGRAPGRRCAWREARGGRREGVRVVASAARAGNAPRVAPARRGLAHLRTCAPAHLRVCAAGPKPPGPHLQETRSLPGESGLVPGPRSLVLAAPRAGTGPSENSVTGTDTPFPCPHDFIRPQGGDS